MTWHRWPLHVGTRVYVASIREVGHVSQMGSVIVTVYLKGKFQRGPQLFPWNSDIVPMDHVVELALGASYEELGIERQR